MCTFILVSPIINSSFYAAVQAEPLTLTTPLGANSISVPGNYSKIQDAVNAAQPGDTIYVDAGTYNENVIVKKSNITIIGHDSSDTILLGNVTGTGFRIQASNVVLNGFKVRNFDTGIYVTGAGNSVTGNYVTDGKFGIWLNSAYDGLVSKNYVIDCEHNLRLSYSTNNTLTENTMQGYASYNFGLFGSSIEHYFQSIDASNTVNDKPIRYITNAENLDINPGTYPDLGVLLVINSSKITVKDITVSNNLAAILFAYVSMSTIKNVNLVNNKIGIELFKSPNVAILNSHIEGNMYHGIISQDSPQGTISGNNIIRNTDGIYMSSNSSIIQQNTIQGNEVAFRLDASFDNLFLYNNIVDNQKQTNIINSQRNIFDDGKEGNYWSNYRGEDSNNDAVGDTRVPHEQLDNHPLMGKYQNYQITKEGNNFTIEIISSGSISDLRLNQTKGTLTLETFTNKTESFSRITIPKALVNNASIVTVNNSQPLFKNVNFNETHATIYLEYSRGFGKIEIGASSSTAILVAKAGPDQKTTTNRIMKFDGNSSTTNLGIKSYKWTFGDGTSGTGVIASHSYSMVGNYTVTLEVADIAGNIASDSLTVTVEQSGVINEGLDSENFVTPTWLLALTVVVDFIAVDAIAFLLLTRLKRKKEVVR